MYKYDPRQFDLAAWAKWVAAGRPLHFSLFGDSTSGKPYEPKHHRTYITDKPLWLDARTDSGESTERAMKLDSAIHGAFSEAERRLLLAATAPSGTGQPLPLVERAKLAGASPDELRSIRRRAMALIPA